MVLVICISLFVLLLSFVDKLVRNRTIKKLRIVFESLRAFSITFIGIVVGLFVTNTYTEDAERNATLKYLEVTKVNIEATYELIFEGYYSEVGKFIIKYQEGINVIDIGLVPNMEIPFPVATEPILTSPTFTKFLSKETLIELNFAQINLLNSKKLIELSSGHTFEDHSSLTYHLRNYINYLSYQNYTIANEISYQNGKFDRDSLQVLTQHGRIIVNESNQNPSVDVFLSLDLESKIIKLK